ncbi:MAG: DUF2461 domain-containing protein [Oscillibacter sp.]|nr:DUF2461 domain-containing protein [Oscillibacter sp.]
MFSGFTDATVDFMWGIRFNNEKAWFEAHKEVYLNEFYYPMRSLGEELCAYLRPLRPEADFVLRVTRIYRDARRLHGRGPYKDSLWFCIEPPADDWTARPTFWFELGPEAWSCGMGYWLARPAEMAKLRARIDRDPDTMSRLTRKLNKSAEFTLEGDAYKRAKGAAPSALLAPWYQLKNVALIHEEKLTEELFDRRIADRLKADYRFLLPYFDYFSTLRGDPEPETLQ